MNDLGCFIKALKGFTEAIHVHVKAYVYASRKASSAF
jgi:hypothetical protein